ncbi:MAG TPA: hypothetical protein VGR68_02580 [Actinomycetota bacterium]|nr:hypothetical protein [Actinomycetota bacterium]
MSVQRFETVLQAEGPGVFIEVPLRRRRCRSGLRADRAGAAVM